MNDFIKFHCEGKFCAIKKGFIVAIIPNGKSTNIKIGDNSGNIEDNIYVDETPEEIWKMINPENDSED